MDKHTAGPWQVKMARTRLHVSGPESRSARGFPRGFYIAELSIGASEDTKAECAANARLIAAAPDMLEALRQVDAAFSSNISTEYLHERIRALLARVKA